MNKYHNENTGKPLNNTEAPMRGGLSLLHEQYDNLFKAIISAGWNMKSDGDVESPSGFFALVEIPDHYGELAEMQDAVGDETVDDEWPDTGWYVSYENSDGLIFVLECASQHVAERTYDEFEEQYNTWASDSDEGEEGED